MGFHIVKEKRKTGDIFIVRSSFRNDSGKSTSINCGIIGKVEDLKNKFGNNYLDEVNSLGAEIYNDWFKKNSDKFVTTIYADEDETEDNVFYSTISSFYLESIRTS